MKRERCSNEFRATVFGLALKWLEKQSGLQQKQIAAQTGIPAGTLSGFKYGYPNRIPRPEHAEQIGAVFEQAGFMDSADFLLWSIGAASRKDRQELSIVESKLGTMDRREFVMTGLGTLAASQVGQRFAHLLPTPKETTPSELLASVRRSTITVFSGQANRAIQELEGIRGSLRNVHSPAEALLDILVHRQLARAVLEASPPPADSLDPAHAHAEAAEHVFAQRWDRLSRATRQWLEADLSLATTIAERAGLDASPAATQQQYEALGERLLSRDLRRLVTEAAEYPDEAIFLLVEAVSAWLGYLRQGRYDDDRAVSRIRQACDELLKLTSDGPKDEDPASAALRRSLAYEAVARAYSRVPRLRHEHDHDIRRLLIEGIDIARSADLRTAAFRLELVEIERLVLQDRDNARAPLVVSHLKALIDNQALPYQGSKARRLAEKYSIPVHIGN